MLEAFRADLGPAAEELQRVLKLPEAEMREACKALAGRLPDLLPEEPAMAAILAEELAGAFAEVLGEVSHEDTKARSAEALANEDRKPDGEFAPKGTGDQTGGSSAASAPSAAKKDEGAKKDEDEKKKAEERTRRLAERESLLSGGPTPIRLDQAKSVLLEPVTVSNANAGGSFRFTSEKLLGERSHLKKDHLDSDYRRRARILLYAIDTAKTSKNFTNSKSSQPNEWGVYVMRKELRKTYTDKTTGKPFTVVVRADRNGDVFEVFDLFPK